MTVDSQFLNYLNNSNIIYNKIISKLLMQIGTDATNAILSVQEARGIAGFVFQCPQEENIELNSDITDYYIEDNSAVQDHIARKPIVITLHGLQGEYYYSNSLANRVLEKVASKLDFVQELMPKIQLAKNLINRYGQVAVKAYKLAKTAVTSASLVKKEGGDLSIYGEAWRDVLIQNGEDLFKNFQEAWKLGSNQTHAYLYFENLWKQSIVFSVETSWKRFDNMTIQNIRVKRDNNADITDFYVTCKQLNFVHSITTDVKKASIGRTEAQKSTTVNNGLMSTTPLSDAEVKKILNTKLTF